jgi:phage terminase large subunit
LIPTIKFAPICRALFESHRYKVYHGGRGGGKSWAFARALLLIGASRTIRVLCAREIQRSIADSVHRLLSDQIAILDKEIPGFADNYTITKNEIKGRNGTLFSFIGLYSNVNQIKSYEGVDYCWIEEAESISQKSWDLIIPTIRKPGSEIWISFNPARIDDPTYEMFITNQQQSSYVQYVTYKDNKYFSEPLVSEMEFMKKNNYSKYLHIWEGQPITDYDTLVYRFDRNINCIDRDIQYNEGFETWASWDFGVSDDTAIIFYQLIKTTENEFGYWIDIFDEYVNNNQPADHYRDVVDGKGYLFDAHACDPSGAARQADLTTWIDKLKKNPISGSIDWHFQYTHKYSVAEMIDRANDIIPYVKYNPHKTPHFHKMAFRWQYRTDKDGKIVLPPKPEHDEFSHVGTSFYYFVINRFPPRSNAKVRILH